MTNNYSKEHNLLRVLIRPIISEKQEKILSKENQYTFEVDRKATKQDIKRAIEGLFNSKVKSIRVLNRKGKEKRSGRNIGRRAGSRRAYVSMKDGQKIDLIDDNRVGD